MKKVVIIGGGLGGLTAGAFLAKNGYDVTLLEQHSIVGGCATVFKRGDFTCEVGLHEMDGVYTNPRIKEIFEILGVYENVEFVKADEFFRIVTKYGEFIMPDNVEKAKQALKERFRLEHKAIDIYFELIEKVATALQKLVDPTWLDYLLFPFKFFVLLRYKNKSVKEVLNSLTNNEELKVILNANVQYYNDTPKTLSFLLHAIAQYSYYTGGGWFIKGGSYKLSEYLASVITQNGGEVITKADVIQASSKDVIYLHKKEKFTEKADVIVSNISPADTYRLFNIPYQETKQIAESIITVYLGFSKNLKTLYPDGKYSNFLFDKVASQEEFEAHAARDITQKDFVFVDYSRVDSKLTSNEKSFGAVCVLDELSIWEDLDKESYKKKKEQVVEHVIKHLEKYYPNIGQYVEYAEMATPKTMQRYVRSPNGTAYGYKPTPKQFFKIPNVRSNKIDNLYFTGQFIIAGGFSPSIMSGYLCFKEILKR